MTLRKGSETGGSGPGEQWARALRFPVQAHGEEAQVLSQGAVPHLTVPAGTFGMPVAPVSEFEHLSLPVTTRAAITAGLPLGEGEELAFQTFLRGLNVDDPHTLQARLYAFFRDHGYTPALRSELLARVRSFYKEAGLLRASARIRANRQRGITPDGVPMGADQLTVPADADASGMAKAEPRGGKYHARVPDGSGGHKYIYDAGKYASRPDAHLRGAEVLRDRARKDILDRVGNAGLDADNLGALGARYDAGLVKDVARELVSSGVLELREGLLRRPASDPSQPADLNKGTAMQKAGEGEGSRGGHITGHTASGKPIYAPSSTAAFQTDPRKGPIDAAAQAKWAEQRKVAADHVAQHAFSPKEHAEASNAHAEAARSARAGGDEAKAHAHSMISAAHDAAGDAQERQAKAEKKAAKAGKPVTATPLNISVMKRMHEESGGKIPTRVPATSAPHMKRALQAGLMEKHPTENHFQLTAAGHAAIGSTQKSQGLHTPPPMAPPVHAPMPAGQAAQVARNEAGNLRSVGLEAPERPKQLHLETPEAPKKENPMKKSALENWLIKAGAVSLPAPTKDPSELAQEKEMAKEAAGDDEGGGDDDGR